MDVVNALAQEGRDGLVVTGGRYGLGSKDTPPSSVFAVFAELAKDAPAREFTVGIVDDVTHLSLPEDPNCPNTAAEGTIECKFWGLGGDGTVGANKNSIKIIGDHTDKYVQAYFQYDSKKTGGVTISHLRFGDSPIKSSYYINKADFVACHNPSYVTKGFRMVNDVKPGGTYLINCQWSPEELDHHLNAEAKRYIAENGIKLYTINAIDLAREIGMGKRTNTILQSAFFTLANVMPQEDAIRYMKEAATKSYLKKGQDVVDMNHRAIDAGATAFRQVEVPASWADAVDAGEAPELGGRAELVKQVREIMEPVGRMDGDRLPVSAFVAHADGQFEQGAAAYEKRGVAVSVPTWDAETCIQCNNCAFVCPHAAIRPFALAAEEAAGAPEGMKLGAREGQGGGRLPVRAGRLAAGLHGLRRVHRAVPHRLAGHGAHGGRAGRAGSVRLLRGARVRQARAGRRQRQGQPVQAAAAGVLGRLRGLRRDGVREAGHAAVRRPHVHHERHGLLVHLGRPGGHVAVHGEQADGHGPAWSNSLFEDNAEHGLGMLLGHEAVRNRLAGLLEDMAASDKTPEATKELIAAYLDTAADGAANAEAVRALVPALEAAAEDGCPVAPEILANKEYLAKKSVWIFGGDGWAYDIGYGGLDHVLASGEDVNVFVFDTEVYSNTGGQASKASNIGQVAQFAAAGKDIKKKSLTEIAMAYGYVYVAQVAMGAKPAQTIKAIAEAEAYPGPSLIIGYSPVRDALHQGRHGQLPGRDEEGRGLRLLEPVPLQPGGSRRQEVRAGLQGAGGRVPGVPHERGALQPPDARVPRARRGAVRAQREGRHGALRAPAQAQGGLRRGVRGAEGREGPFRPAGEREGRPGARRASFLV